MATDNPATVGRRRLVRPACMLAAAMLLSPGIARAVPPAAWMLSRDLLAHWSFEDTALDEVSGLSGAIESRRYVPGRVGRAVQFDAADYKDFLKIDVPEAKAAPFADLESVTVALWIRPDSRSAANGVSYLLTSMYDETAWSVDLSKKALRFELNWHRDPYPDSTLVAGVQGNTSAPDPSGLTHSDAAAFLGSWHHAAFTYSAATRKTTYYLDGVAIGERTSTTALSVNLRRFWLGGFNWDWSGSLARPTQTFRGLMDEVQIFGTALTAAELKRIYAETPALPPRDAEVVLTAAEYRTEVSRASASPVAYAADLPFRGTFDAWAGLTGLALPAAASHRQGAWDSNDDLSADVRFAHNATTFFLSVRVTDNVYVPRPGGSNWNADSVQFAFASGGMRSEYGVTLGAGDAADVVRYADGGATVPPTLVNAQVRRTGASILYEMAIPWTAVLAGPPSAGDTVSFNVTINDCDDPAGAREGFVEWTGGIGVDKSIAKMGALRLLPSGETWAANLAGPAEITSGETGVYNLLIPNMGARTVNLVVDIPALGVSQRPAAIPAGGALKRSFSLAIDQSQTVTATAREPSTGKTSADSIAVRASRNAEQLTAIYRDLKDTVIPRLAARIQATRKAGLATDYEMVNLAAMQYTVDFILDDIRNQYMSRAEYAADALYGLARQAESDLEAYARGQKTPLGPVSRYRTGKIGIDGYSVVGNTTAGPRKPVILSGYGMFDQVQTDIPLFPDLGTNLINFNIYPSELFKKPGLVGWSTWSKTGSTRFAVDDAERSGSSSARITVTEKSDSILFETPAVRPNTTYTISGWMRTEGTPHAMLFSNHGGWLTGPEITSATWKKAELEFTTGTERPACRSVSSAMTPAPSGWTTSASWRRAPPGT